MRSTSTITNSSYDLPGTKCDKPGIESFLDQHRGKKVVVVQGLGFVGAVMSIVVANALTEEYAVIGVDLADENSYWKICSINEGVFPVISSDKKVDEFFARARRKKNFYATFDPYAYTVADIIIVDINLDVQKFSADKNNGYEVDLSSFRRAVETIAGNCRHDVLVLVETTVPPGTCEKVVEPLFREHFERRGLPRDYRIGHSYERVMPGPGYVDSIQNFYRVYSGVDKQSADATEAFLKTIISTEKYPLTRLHSTTASEMSKVLENSFRAMNIAFIDEWTAFAEEAGVNLPQVIDAIRLRPTHKNIMYPGLGVGGYCLPKDPLLASWSRQHLFNGKPLAQSENAVEVNDRMPEHTYELIVKNSTTLNRKLVGMLGVSYLNNVGDTRYSPAELLYNRLVQAGAKVIICDEYVPFWTETNMFSIEIPDLIGKKPEILVFCTRHEQFMNNELFDKYIVESTNLLIVDAVHVLNEDQVRRYSVNNKVVVVGRGDLH
jgi:UDP-N-acetyl-D-glucosamine dehydrogenase